MLFRVACSREGRSYGGRCKAFGESLLSIGKYPFQCPINTLVPNPKLFVRLSTVILQRKTYFLCHCDKFCKFRVIPVGALITSTLLASSLLKKPTSPVRRFFLVGALSSRAIPLFSASRSARSKDRSIPLMKLKSLSKAAVLARSLRLT